MLLACCGCFDNVVNYESWYGSLCVVLWVYGGFVLLVIVWLIELTCWD